METTVIDVSGMPFRARLAAMRQSETLFRFLMLRDIRLRYRRTYLGVTWAFLQPVAPMLLSSLVFSRALAPSIPGAVPYWLFALSGLTIWSFFAAAVNVASATLVQNQSLLNKVWFPRAILPFAAVTAVLLDLALSMTLLLGLSMWNGLGPSPRWLLLPFVVAIIYLFTLMTALLMASLTALVRDAKHAFAFVLQVWMLASPVVYPSTLLKGTWRTLLAFNPMAGLLEAFRWCLFGGSPAWDLIGAAAIAAVLVTVTALWLFHRLEDDLAERA